MQILPSTAHYIARKSGGTEFEQGDLAKPQINISYGSWYLRYLLDHYEGNERLAIAAYNAGETNVDKWVAEAGGPESFDRDADIPFPETRAYVASVEEKKAEYRGELRRRARYSLIAPNGLPPSPIRVRDGRMRQRVAALFALLAALLAMAGSAHAAVFDVNTTDDTPDADPTAETPCADTNGNCSLRAAIDQANSNIGEDTINLPNGRYVLSIENANPGGENQNATGDLDIGINGPESGDTNIVGESTADTIVDANSLDRAFHVFDGTDSEVSFDVDISDLTITGGAPQSSGGGILNQVWDTLTLERVRVTRNVAVAGGGILNSGHAVLLASTVDRNFTAGPGGGICSSGELNVEDSTVNDNTAGILPLFLGFGSGGGIAAGEACDEQAPCICPGSESASVAAEEAETRRELTIENSTIDGNDATFGIGGGIAIEDGDASLLNATVTDNVAGFAGVGGGVATAEEGTMGAREHDRRRQPHAQRGPELWRRGDRRPRPQPREPRRLRLHGDDQQEGDAGAARAPERQRRTDAHARAARREPGDRRGRQRLVPGRRPAWRDAPAGRDRRRARLRHRRLRADRAPGGARTGHPAAAAAAATATAATAGVHADRAAQLDLAELDDHAGDDAEVHGPLD